MAAIARVFDCYNFKHHLDMRDAALAMRMIVAWKSSAGYLETLVG